MAKIMIVAHGDPSVGIPDETIWVEMPMLWDEDEEYNEFIRENLRQCFGEIYDTGSLEVYLSEDEIYTGE